MPYKDTAQEQEKTYVTKHTEKHKENQYLFEKYHKAKTEEEKSYWEDEIIKANEKLVKKEASRFSFFFNTLGFDFDDLCQIGNIGLLRAIRKYDPKRAKLATYAVNDIKANLRREVMGKYLIHTPTHMVDQFPKFNKAIKKITDDNKEITLENIVEYSGLKEKDVSYLIEINNRKITSLDKPLNEELENSWGLRDYISSKETSVEDKTTADIGLDKIEKAIRKYVVNPKHVDIILDKLNGDGITMQALANRYGISRERVRKIIEDNTRGNSRLARFFERSCFNTDLLFKFTSERDLGF
ncbi:MAG: sigma-70 family RNA polymerase sigma factor [Nanoarchaeota archaeon]|nr:sigma-70 family RNA polymerase sigma factor [Nanoarchaeota archaeon]